MRFLPATLVLLLTFNAGIAAAENDRALAERYLKYRELVRLTAERINNLFENYTDLCIDPSHILGPHFERSIHLYANPVALAAKGRIYPLGALIVKEKFASAADMVPDIITVMEKTGNLGRVEDWKFTMVRVSDRTVIRDGFKVSCSDCHSRYDKTDFVSSVTANLMTTFGVRK